MTATAPATETRVGESSIIAATTSTMAKEASPDGPTRAAQIGGVLALGSGEHCLGQRWTVVGRVRLVTDQDYRILVAAVADGLDGTASSESAADDDEGLLCHVTYPWPA
jgi:hypothetical protein